MKKRQAELQAEVDRWLAAAEAADAEDHRLHGNKRGEELPDWVADKQKRIARIAEAKTELEAEAKAAADEERRIEAEKQKSREANGRKKTGKPAAPPSDEPAQRHSAISPIRKAAFSKPGMASSRARLNAQATAKRRSSLHTP
jgi:hypothetical protein